MADGGNTSPYDEAMQMMNTESNARKQVATSLASVQSQLNHLSQSIMTNSSMPTAPLATTSAQIIDGVPATASQSPMMCAGPPGFLVQGTPPGMQVLPNSGFVRSQPQLTAHQMNVLAQINMLNDHLQSLKKDFFESGRKFNGIYDTLDNIWGELNEQKQYYSTK